MEETPEGARLLGALRELRARTGLSLAGLAARTAYSKSSWERYLNGKKPVPRDAVEQLCRLAGEQPQHWVALWELADAAWSGRGAPGAASTGAVSLGSGTAGVADTASASEAASGAASEAEAERPYAAPDLGTPAPRRPWWRRTRALVATGAAGVLLCASVVVAAVARSGTEEPEQQWPRPVTCTDENCTGRSASATQCAAHFPRTVGTFRPRDGMWLDLRYAKDCRAGWARVYGQRPGDAFEVSVPGEPAQRLRIRDAYEAEDRLSTAMVATEDPGALRVCYVPAVSGGRECFGKKS